MYNNKEELRVARLTFLEDTIAYYSVDVSRRAVVSDKGGCYKTDDGRKCAIGRYIPDDKYDPRIENCIANNSKILELLPNEILKLEGLDELKVCSFLVDIQKLHDINEYWNDEGLSEKGLKKVARIKCDYELGESND